MRSINYSRLRSLKARDLIGALVRDGFEFDRQRGSHHLYYHPDGRRVTGFFPPLGRYIPTKDPKAHYRGTSWMD